MAMGRRRKRVRHRRAHYQDEDGRTHLAHKAQHAVDMETGAIVAVTLHGADEGDTGERITTVVADTRLYANRR